jgi:two-component system C4-dicarboxylate transport sensor histidine kinase DctB
MQQTDTVGTHRDGDGDPPGVAADLRANRYDVLSRLAEDLAHEIKNPLNAIVVNLEVLRRRVVNAAADAALDRASVIEHEVRRVHSLVDQLLQLMRPAKFEASPVAVDAILESLAPIIQIQAKAAHVSLTYELGSDLFAEVQPESLKFALLNLTGHAIDAESRAGGAVSIVAIRAKEKIYIVVRCSQAVLRPDHEQIKLCSILMNSAGGTLESLEPAHDGNGSTATLVMPPGKFA